MCGVTFRRMETSRKSVVVCTTPLVMDDSAAYGMFSPMEISAGLLSVTITCGVEMTLTRFFSASALTVAWKFRLTTLYLKPVWSAVGVFRLNACPKALEPASAFDGTNHLVVWFGDSTSGLSGYTLRAVRIAPDGSILDPGGIVLGTATMVDNGLAVAFDGVRFVVAWVVSTSYGFQIRARCIATDGTANATDIVVFGGGIIPQDDIPELRRMGVAEVFGPGTSLASIVDWVRANVPAPLAKAS